MVFILRQMDQVQAVKLQRPLHGITLEYRTHSEDDFVSLTRNI